MFLIGTVGLREGGTEVVAIVLVGGTAISGTLSCPWYEPYY